MPVKYEPDYPGHVAYIRGYGRITFEDCLALCERQRAEVRHRLHEVNDYRGARVEISGAESRRLTQINVELYAEVPGIRVAVVADPEVAAGIEIAFGRYVGDAIEYRIFTDLDEALAWVDEAVRAEELGLRPAAPFS